MVLNLYNSIILLLVVFSIGATTYLFVFLLDTAFCYKACLVSSKTDRHDITKILLKVLLNTITLTHFFILILYERKFS